MLLNVCRAVLLRKDPGGERVVNGSSSLVAGSRQVAAQRRAARIVRTVGDCRLDAAIFLPCTPWPGSNLYERLRDRRERARCTGMLSSLASEHGLPTAASQGHQEDPCLPRSAQRARWNRVLGYGLARGPERLSRSVGQHTPWLFS